MPPRFQQISSTIAHEGEVNAVCIGSRTGSVYASGGEDRVLNLWTIGGKNPTLTFGPFQSSVTACKFSDREDKILAGNNGGTVMLFNLNEERNEATWSAHRSAVNDVCFHSQNNSLVLTCGYDGKVNLLSKQQRHPVQWYANHKGPANTIDISPDGRYVATGGDDKTVRIFDLTASKEIAKFSCHEEAVRCVRFHPTEPVLCSCSDDRSVRFFDLTMNKEIHVAFPLDTQSVPVIRFAQCDQAALSISQDCMKIMGWEPATVFQKVPFGFPNPKDLAVVDDTIIVASTNKDRVVIHKMKTTGIKPFSSYPNERRRTPNFFDDEPKQKSRGSTPRLIDMDEMPKSKVRATSQTRKGPIYDDNDDDEGYQPIPARVVKETRPGSVNPRKEISSAMSSARSRTSMSTVYSDFRKERTPFMTTMNERYSKLARINDALDTLTLGEVLKQIAESGKQANEILGIIAMKPEILTLEYSAFIMQIATIVLNSNAELAIRTIETMMQSFGAFVRATLASKPTLGADLAYDERKQKCQAFVLAFKQAAPQLKKIATSNQYDIDITETAKEILEQWKGFIK